jgi:hypothetical protein
MNQKLFDKLMVKGSGPYQRRVEWEMFLETCDKYLSKYNIKHPVVVEIGTFKNRQKKFYEQLFNAQHIGININAKHEMPDILGNSHDEATLHSLVAKLRGRAIDILYIDASHRYESVEKDYEIYGPLCTGVIGFHDIESGRYEARKELDGVYRFWEDLRTLRYKETEESEKWLFLSIHQCHFKDKIRRGLGIGVIVKR